jgi:hypothetical protein
MLRRFAVGASSLILLVASLPAGSSSVVAAENALDAIATDASIVFRLKNPKATIDKVADLVELVVKGQGEQVRTQSAMLGMAISNPTLAGVNMEADWYVAMYTDDEDQTKAKEEGDNDPTFVFIVPATDLAAMKNALGDSVKFMEHGKFGVYTSDEATAKSTAQRLKGEGKSIATLIDKDSRAVFDGGDLSLFINVKQLAADYKDEIEEFKEQTRQKIESFPAGGPGGAGGVNQQQLTDIADLAMQIVSALLSDAQSCTVAAVVSKEGLAFEDLVKVISGSATDKLLAKSPPGGLSSVSSLPAGYLAYLGFAWDMSDIAKLNHWIMGLGASSLKPEATKELEATLAEVTKLKIGSLATAFGLGDVDDGAVRTVSVTEVDNPAKMRELTQKVLKAMQGVETPGIKQTVDMKKDAEKYGKNSADIATVKTEMEDQGNPFGQIQERIMTMLFGPDGMVTRNVYLKDRVVQTMGGGKQAMTDALASIEQKPGDSSKSPIQQSRAKLGSKSNLVILFDVSNTIAKAVDLVVQSQLVPIPLDPDQIKGLQSKPSFFGLSAGTEPQGLRVKTLVPVEQMQGIARIVNFVQQMMGGVGGEN